MASRNVDMQPFWLETRTQASLDTKIKDQSQEIWGHCDQVIAKTEEGVFSTPHPTPPPPYHGH